MFFATRPKQTARLGEVKGHYHPLPSTVSPLRREQGGLGISENFQSPEIPFRPLLSII